MISRKHFLIVSLFLLVLFNCLSAVNASVVTSTPFNFSLFNGESFQIQIQNSPKFIKFTVQNGDLQGNGQLAITAEAGSLQITPSTNGTLTITFPGEVNLAINNKKYSSPVTYNFISGKSFTVQWNYSLQIWIPVMLGLGLCGLAMTTIAPVYFIRKIKSGDWDDAFCWGFLMVIIGIALIIAWLWS